MNDAENNDPFRKRERPFANEEFEMRNGMEKNNPKYLLVRKK